MQDFKIQDNLLITNDFSLEFESKINLIEKVNDLFLVLLEVKKGTKDVDNLYGVDNNGKVIWRIQSVNDAFGIVQNTPYVALKVLCADRAQVTSFFGMRFIFYIDSGKMLEKECIGW